MAKPKMSTALIEQSSAISRFTWFWILPLLGKCYRSVLTVGDLGGLVRGHYTTDVLERLNAVWKDDKSTSNARTARTTDKVPKSLLSVILHAFWVDISLVTALKFLCDVAAFTVPYLLIMLVEYSQSPFIHTWRVYIYATIFILSVSIQPVILANVAYLSYNIGNSVRAAVVAMVYRKILSMAPKSRAQSTSGQIFTLITTDADHFVQTFRRVWGLTTSPLCVIVGVVLLHTILGRSAIMCVILLVGCVPLNYLAATRVAHYHALQSRFKDARLKMINEVISGIKVIKMFAWEPVFQRKIDEIRESEVNAQIQSNLYLGVFIVIGTCLPNIILMAMFVSYVFLFNQGHITADKAFASTVIFSSLQMSLAVIPSQFSNIARLKTSLHRLNDFLRLEDRQPLTTSVHESSITIENGSFSWDNDNEFTLQGIDLEVPKGQLLAIVGQVGAGKSSLISAVLGQMQRLSGTVYVQGSVAYISQVAWIQNLTLRDNILFGQPYDYTRYQEVISACALTPDLDILPAGDLTEIGEKGINLSGGQKQRVSIARAVYSQADVYLFDDPLSAVDSHVAKHIFDNVISHNGILSDKTRVLVTHGMLWLPHVDQIIIMENGRIIQRGTYEQVGPHLATISDINPSSKLDENKAEIPENSDDDIYLPLTNTNNLHKQFDDITINEKNYTQKSNIAQTDQNNEIIDDNVITTIKDNYINYKVNETEIRKRLSRLSSHPDATDHRLSTRTEDDTDSKQTVTIDHHMICNAQGDSNAQMVHTDKRNKLVEEEDISLGQVSWSVYGDYIRAAGHLTFLSLFLCQIGFQASMILAAVYVSKWTDDDLLKNVSIAENSPLRYDTNLSYVSWIVVFLIFQVICMTLTTISMAYGFANASRQLHSAMLSNLLRCPMSFFDTTPTGRIINRFSNDIASVDDSIPCQWINLFISLFSPVTAVIQVTCMTPMFVVFVPALVAVFVFIKKLYVSSTRQLKRYISQSRSPILSHFSEALSGVDTIQAYRAEGRFISQSADNVDQNQLFIYYHNACSCWLDCFGPMPGCLAVAIGSVLAVSRRHALSRSGMGLSLASLVQLCNLNYLVSALANLESGMVAVERITEYTHLPNEDEWRKEENSPDRSWPSEGHVEFRDFSARYRPELDLVLKCVNIDILPGEKIGIVGRTGSGKTSLTLSLFRLIHCSSGAILIDDLDISCLGLHDLRPRITILPQDPHIFAASIRENLDPFVRYTDAELWWSLRQTRLDKFVEGEGGLAVMCEDGGNNLSVGQRQLLCLARALLSRTKLLILDEATSSVDLETDKLIHETIREAFSGCTVMSIAHRISSVRNFDRILVMRDGQVAEFDTPSNLLNDKSSLFHELAVQAKVI